MTNSSNQEKARSSYVLGHSERELARLERQAGLFAGMTRDILARAGLRSGMRVLDIGCGVGDVAMIAADLVGPTGSVLGIDPSQEALSVAQSRLAALGKDWVRFAPGTLEGVEDATAFDAVIGRFILIHLADPADALRTLLTRLRPGATVAFVEFDLSTAHALPPLPLLQQCISWISEVYRRTGRQLDMGSSLFGTYRAAGLTPQMIGLTRITSGEDQAGFDFVVESVRSLMPAMEMLGIAQADSIGIDTLRERLAAEAAADDHCIFYPRLIGAWADVR